MTDEIIPLRSKRQELGVLLQKLQHGLPAFVLLMAGLHRVQSEAAGASLVLAAAEITLSVSVIFAFVRDLRASRLRKNDSEASAHHGVDWFDLVLGAMLIVETWSHWHETGHVKRPTLLLAVVMMAIGLLHGRLAAWGQRRRALRLTPSGLAIGGKLFGRVGRLDAAWTDIARIELDARVARIVRKDGRRRTINLGDLRNAREVREALERAQHAVAAAAQPPSEPPARHH